MLVTDLRHLLALPEDVPGPTRRLAEHLYDVVRAATSGDTSVVWASALPCRRRPGNRRCVGRILLLRAETEGPIAWECSSCGDGGRISDWENSPYDLRCRRPTKSERVHQLCIPDEVATTLRTIMVLDSDCERAVVSGDRTGDAPPRPRSAATGLPELDIARVQRWCGARVPEHARDQVRVECEVATRHLTIVERRAPWREDVGPEWTSLPIARLAYTKATKTWKLYWRDRNLRFHAYEPLAPSPYLETLLSELERDPTCIFWG